MAWVTLTFRVSARGVLRRLQLIFVLALAMAWGQIDARAQSSEGVRYPLDSGVVNVKTQYGARGDGQTDDTTAIIRAIGENRGLFERILYFPSGTYLVSSTLRGITQDGTWKARLTFQGENEKSTIIRLKDNLPEFQDPSAPQAVIQTGSIDPYHKTTGDGNNGFRNYFFNLTVDTGSGNPGAVGVDYLGNNICGLEDVTIRSGDPRGVGVAGLSMKRSYVGPCLYKRLEIDGFDYGIRTAATENSHTFEHIRLTGQHIAGISNDGNVLSIRDLRSSNEVPAIINSDPKGLVTLIDSELSSPAPVSPSAIVNSGGLLLRNVSVSGYAGTVSGEIGAQAGGNIIEYFSPATVPSGFSRATIRQRSGNATLNLPVRETPEFGSNDLSQWVNVRSRGAIPDGKTDSTKAIQEALDSSASVVYLPAGNYRVTDTLRVRGRTQKILGLGAVLLPDGPRFADSSAPVSLLRLESQAGDMAIEGVQFGWWNSKNYPGVVWLENVSQHTLVLEHVDFQGLAKIVYKAGPGISGPVFIEDVEGFRWQFDAPQQIWARQFDVEGHVETSKVYNNGASLWILGMKTEDPQTIIDTENGGSTELLGGLFFSVRPVAPGVPTFIVNRSSAMFSYVTSAYKPENNYEIQVQVDRGEGPESIKRTEVTKRGYGSLATIPIISPKKD